MSVINEDEIKKIKREAKKLKKSHPGLSHCQLLDLSARNISGTRNYHEANKRAKDHQSDLIEMEDAHGPNPGHHGPKKCPNCGAIDSFQLIDEDIESMTDGQLADYEAGFFGVSICLECDHEVDWQV